MSNSVERLWPGVDVDPPEPKTRADIPPNANQEISELKSSLEDLNLSLEKANRRINRLIGENKQLSAILEKRDDQLARLNRELGHYAPFSNGLEQPNSSVAMSPSSVSGIVSSIIDRLRLLFLKEKKPDTQSDAGLSRPIPEKSGYPSLAASLGGRGDQRVVGVVLFGLNREELEQLLPLVEKDCSSRGMRPLCLIDVDAFELFRSRGLIFEYLPSADERNRFDDSMHWNLYLQRRLSIIRRKWDPLRIVAFGDAGMKALSLWSSSPFEKEPLPAATIGSSVKL